MIKIAQGAEAVIYEDGSKIIKDRIKKSYRLPEIDLPLRRQRTKHEAELLARAARVGVSVPVVISQDATVLTMELIKGTKVRDYLTKENCEEICKSIGVSVSKLHLDNIIHGDLTTSNIIWSGKPVFIDFGLGQVSPKTEDKAVDVHLFKECLRSKHFDIYRRCWDAFKRAYKNKAILEQLKKVEARGRYKS